MSSELSRRSKSPSSPDSDDEYEDDIRPEDSRSIYSGGTSLSSNVKRRQVQFKRNSQEEDLYTFEYSADLPAETVDALSRQSSLSRQNSALGRQGSFFSRNISMMSRSSTIDSLFTRANTLGQTIRRIALGRLEFENEADVAEAAEVLEERRRKVLEEGEGALERVTTLMMARTETLARTLTLPFEMARQKTLQTFRNLREKYESEEVQATLQRTKTQILRISTGRPSWDPEPRKVPIPSSFNLCTVFIIGLAVLLPLLFYLPSSRGPLMSTFVGSQMLATFAGPTLPPLALPELGQVCSSGGFAKQRRNPGSPSLNSTWWSSALGDGAQIQIQSVSGGYWWGPPSSPSAIQGQVRFSPPSAKVALGLSASLSTPPTRSQRLGTYFNALDLEGPVQLATDSLGGQVAGHFRGGRFYLGEAGTAGEAPSFGATELYLLVLKSTCYNGQFAVGTLYNGVFYNGTFVEYVDVEGFASEAWGQPRGRRLTQVDMGRTGVKTVLAQDSGASPRPPPSPPPDSSANASWPQFPAWGQSPLGCFSKDTPAVTTFLTVERINGSSVYLRAPNGRYVTPTTAGEIVAVAQQRIPSAVFHVAVVDNTTVRLRTYDGRHVAAQSSEGSGRLRLSEDPGESMELRVREVVQVARMRGVNLGGWLLVEEWMTPRLYEGVADLADGWQLQLQSASTGKYVTTWQNDYKVHCNSENPQKWETWHVRRENASLQLRNRPSGSFLSASNGGGGSVYASGLDASSHETFTLHVSPFDGQQAMLEAASGQMLRARSDGSLDAAGAPPGDLAQASTWGGDTTFRLHRVNAVQGEWQVSRWAPEAQKLLEAHRKTFLEERHWQQVAGLGVNTVRIPVGYWVTQGDSLDAPFVPGSLALLDAAFVLAEKYNIRVFLSMHGAPGGQNYGHECASRDGILDWGRGDTRQRTLNAVARLAERYAKSKALFGIGVLNEPNVDLTSHLSVDDLKKYHVEAYNVIREYSPCCFVGISGFLGGKDSDFDGHMTDPLKYNNVVYDLHYYTVFDPNTNQGLKAGEIFNYVKDTWGQQIQKLQQGGRVVMIGEWSLALPRGSKAGFNDYKTFSRVQLETYNNASGGWFFWNFNIGEGSTGYPNWSMKDAFPRGWLHY